jgi:diguanylate cyclase (GGDEF)-like protein/PAS domain S-box-containing protein
MTRLITLKRQAEKLARQNAESSKKSQVRYQKLFETSEVAILEENLSAVYQALDALRQAGVTDLRGYLESNIQVAGDLAALVEIIKVNQATLKLFGIQSHREIDFGLSERAQCRGLVSKPRRLDTIHVFINELCAIWNQDNFFRSEARYQTLDGREIVAIISMPIPQTLADSYSVPVSIFDITEQKRVEEALRESEESYRGVVKDMPGLLCRFLPSGELTYINQAYSEYFHKTSEQLIGSNFLSLIPEADREMVMANISALTVDASIQCHEHQVITADGEIRWQRWINRALFDDRGQIFAYQAIGEDITPLHQAQEVLSLQARRAEALLELPQVAEQVDEADFMQRGQELAEDLTGSQIAFIHFVNDDEQTIQLVAWSRRTIEQPPQSPKAGGLHSQIPVPPRIGGLGGQDLALRQRRPVVFNDYPAYPHKHGLPQGHAELKRMISVPVIENGKVVMLAGVGNKATHYTDRDVKTVQLIANEIWRIVQRRRVLNQLKASERRLQDAQRVAQIGSWELNLDTKKLIWSDQVYRIFEMNQEDFGGSYDAFLDLIHPMDRDRVKQAYTDALANGTTYEITHRLLMADGRIKYVHEQCETDYAADGRPQSSIGTVQDITEQFLASEKLQEAAAFFRSTAEGVLVTDLNGTILNVNPAFTEITGYSRAEILGKNPRMLKSGRHNESFYRDLWTALKTQGNWRGEIWNRRKNGSIYPELLTISTVENDQGQPTSYVAVFSDISTVKRSEERLNYLAHHDPLTDLPNRLLFNDRLSQSIQSAMRHNQTLAVVFIDLDRFKHINDSMGHAVGDRLLQQLAQRLKKALRQSDTVARISGDEFVILLNDIKSSTHATVAVERLMDIFQTPFNLEGKEIHMTSSMGISIFPHDAMEPGTLLRNADTAMYQAKQEGRNLYRFYAEEMTTAASEYVLMENSLRVALKQQQFYLVYQPQVDLRSNRFVGIEALLRWHHPELGQISPVQFIPLAEQTGLIREIGAWVLQTACHQGKVWLDRGLEFGRIAVNVAGPQLKQGDFVQVVRDALEQSGLPAKYLGLEVTEGFVMDRPGERIEQLELLRGMGIQINIDDFGTGYSSLSYLKRLPIDKLKIDKSFVRDIPQSANDMAISEAIIALGKALEMKIIAEGVETQEQAVFLRDMGCHQAQGYFYSKPISPEDIEILFRKYSSS